MDEGCLPRRTTRRRAVRLQRQQQSRRPNCRRSRRHDRVHVDRSCGKQTIAKNVMTMTWPRIQRTSPDAAGQLLGGIDPVDLEITIDVEVVSADLTLFRSRPFKGLREAIGPLARALTGDGGGSGGGGGRRQRHSNTRLGGLDPTERLKQMDRDAMNHRVLRAERRARLEELQMKQDGDDAADAASAGRLLTGGDDPNASLNAAQGASLVPFQAGKITAGAIPDGPAMASASNPDELLAAAAAAPAKLHLARSCYICKSPYRELHAFYAQLCKECASLNWRKRSETCNLHGRVALVTGGRVKIGFRIVLKLLRCGCR